MPKKNLQQIPDPNLRTDSSAKKGIRVMLFGIMTSAFLAAVKILAGVLGHSYALIADGIESILDIFSSFVVLGSLKIASIPPDSNHPYGHGKAESLGAMVIAMSLLVAAVGIAVASIREILTPHHAPAAFTLFVLITVVATKEIMFRFFMKTGQSIGSKAMKTDAWHQRSDALTSAAAFIGISISLIAGEGYESADDWAALFACGVIIYNGLRLFRSALDDVMDAAPPPEIERQIRAIAESVNDVRKIEKCRIRKSGLSFFVEAHVVVAGTITVRRGHEIGHEVKNFLLKSNLNVMDVAVHIEPSED